MSHMIRPCVVSKANTMWEMLSQQNNAEMEYRPCATKYRSPRDKSLSRDKSVELRVIGVMDELTEQSTGCYVRNQVYK
jgi:hypothetical protein